MKIVKTIFALSLCGQVFVSGQANGGSTHTAATSSNVTVKLSTATVIGKVADGVESFAGIPFASPPTGNLRLRPPQRIRNNIGVVDGTRIAGACPQQAFRPEDLASITGVAHIFPNLLGGVPVAPKESEDCLTVTVTMPKGTRKGSKLPILFWIYGGAFEVRSPQFADFYCVEKRLLDQRMGLEWVADNIAEYGGNPEQVVIWGLSAGSVSVLDQLVLYNGNNTYAGTGIRKPLFHGAIMSSGSIIPTNILRQHNHSCRQSAADGFSQFHLYVESKWQGARQNPYLAAVGDGSSATSNLPRLLATNCGQLSR
ncbi:hypothetical protein EYR41_008857 [Orbilia oligospora]|uniref:Carboxylesterase type B domain-containing protein n=1 Tax=Orbilia oligospora TaxID=2813651 RepID=A0A7C8JVK8_ORBOL|nr:hypothetical protein TWF751_003533 [Orbilia oligospora]TGJ64847.1 hypothetical protein EYR41_008857 [Orbilia oligospora]